MSIDTSQPLILLCIRQQLYGKCNNSAMSFIWAIGFSHQLLHKNVDTIQCDSYMLINNAIMHGNPGAHRAFIKIYLRGIGGG